MFKNNYVEIGIALIAILLVSGVFVYIVLQNKEMENKYITDINDIKNTGNIMYNHLVACYATAECLNDMNACKDPININAYGKACLNTDKNIVDSYNIFRKE